MMLSPGWGWVAGMWHVCGNHHHHVPTLHRIDPPLPQCGVCTPSGQQVRCGEYVGSAAASCCHHNEISSRGTTPSPPTSYTTIALLKLLKDEENY